MAASTKSGEVRVALLALALVGLLLLGQHAAPADAAEGGAAAAPASPKAAGKRKNSFSFNNAGGRTLTSFSMNAHKEAKNAGAGGGDH
ncbi:hypothetical protein ACP4OV_029776 [Aristida adscensionis]